MVPYRISFSEDQSTFLSRKRLPQSVTSSPKWPTVFLPSIGHTSSPSASSFGLQWLLMGDLSWLHQVWQPGPPTKTEGLLPLCSSCHILPPKYIIGRRPFFPVLSYSFLRPSLPHCFPRAIFLLHCLYLVPLELWRHSDSCQFAGSILKLVATAGLYEPWRKSMHTRGSALEALKQLAK